MVFQWCQGRRPGLSVGSRLRKGSRIYPGYCRNSYVQQPGEPQADCLRRPTQPVEDRPFPGCEGCVALRADQALLLARVHAKVALPGLASGGAVKIGTKCVSKVHALPPGSVLGVAKS